MQIKHKAVKVIIATVMAGVVLLSGCSVKVSAQSDLSTWKQCYEDTEEKYRDWASELEEEYDLPKGSVEGVIWHESRWNPSVRNSYGAVGFMGVSTKKDNVAFLVKQGVIKQASDLNDPYTNLKAGCAILRYCLDSSPSIEAAFCKYACGEGNYVKRMKKDSGYCKSTYELVWLTEQYAKYFEEKESVKFMMNEYSVAEKQYQSYKTLYETYTAEYKKSYAEYMMNAALERMNYIETEIAKVEGELE